MWRMRASLATGFVLLCVLLLGRLSHIEALEEGDGCLVKENLPGVCKASSKCEPVIDDYIKTGALTIDEVPSCGLGTHEEIVCCPIAVCCEGKTRPSQVQRTKARTTTARTATTTRRTIAVAGGSRNMKSGEKVASSDLDVESKYFDLQELLNIQQKQKLQQPQRQQQQPKPITHEDIQEQPSFSSITASLSAPQFQDVGIWGHAPAPSQKESKIINRPQSLMQQRPTNARKPQQPRDLIHLVNDRLRHQGMNIVTAQQETEMQLPREGIIKTTTMPNFDLDPWAPFRFREPPIDVNVSNELGNGNAVIFGPTPTSRVDIPDRERPAMRACHQFQERQNKPALTKHILDGTEVGEGVYPHMAAIAFSVFGTFEYRCGGSLISSRHVLTAAHCVSSNLPVHVRLGALDIYDGKEYQDIAVTSNVTLHPEYLSGSKYYDIAVLELVKEATLNDMVYPACLALNTVDPPETAELFVAGWGVMNQTTQRTSKKLLRAPLSIVPLNDCNNSYAEMPNTQRHLPNGVIKSLLCAKDTKNAKADACQGDSGGPLILEEDIENKKYSILGIINSGFGCATKTPGLYTRVASFVDWIEQIVWPNNVV